MLSAIRDSFERSFALYRDLLAAIEEPVLARRLGELPSNTVGAQLWCVVGARESYARAIRAGAWDGFSCSLEDAESREHVAAAFQRSENEVREALANLDLASAAGQRLVLDLLEHEAQHHGQLIRYLYGLRLPIPDSWKARYALD